MIAWENDLLILYYVYYIKYTSNQIAYVRTRGRGVKNWQNFAYVLMDGPLNKVCLKLCTAYTFIIYLLESFGFFLYFVQNECILIA